MKTNQYKVTIFPIEGGQTRVEIWWYEYKPNEVTGELKKEFTWAMFQGCFKDVATWIGCFFRDHYPNNDASWPLSDKGKEPKRGKDNQTDFQF